VRTKLCNSRVLVGSKIFGVFVGDFLPPTKDEVNVFARVCLSVCLSVSKITQKRVHGFG